MFVLLLVGCSKTVPVPLNAIVEQKGVWYLESYDASKGYTFSKDGVQYLAHCSYWTLIGAEKVGNWRKADGENWCAAVLDYLHKPIPLEAGDLDMKDHLIFKGQKPGSTSCEFVIVSAK